MILYLANSSNYLIHLDQPVEWPGYRNYSLFNSNQTDSEADPASNLMGAGDSFPGDKAATE
jgi:hypothetical protein